MNWFVILRWKKPKCQSVSGERPAGQWGPKKNGVKWWSQGAGLVIITSSNISGSQCWVGPWLGVAVVLRLTVSLFIFMRLMPVLLGVRSMSCGSGCELSNLVGSLARNCSLFQRFSTLLHGCFLKCGYPQNTPNWSFLVGKPIVVGYHHFRKPRISVPDADTYTLWFRFQGCCPPIARCSSRSKRRPLWGWQLTLKGDTSGLLLLWPCDYLITTGDDSLHIGSFIGLFSIVRGG